MDAGEEKFGRNLSNLTCAGVRPLLSEEVVLFTGEDKTGFLVLDWGISKKRVKEGDIVRRLRRLTQMGMGGACGSMRKCGGFMQKGTVVVLKLLKS